MKTLRELNFYKNYKIAMLPQPNTNEVDMAIPCGH